MTHTRGIAAILAVAAMAAALLVPADCDMPDVLPVPKPNHEGAWVVVLERSENRPELVTEILNDATWKPSLESRGLHYRTYDDQTEDGKAYIDAVDSLPAVVIVAKDKTVLHKGPLPATVGELDELIAEVTGR